MVGGRLLRIRLDLGTRFEANGLFSSFLCTQLRREAPFSRSSPASVPLFLRVAKRIRLYAQGQIWGTCDLNSLGTFA
jgi:hypothetical protein